MKIRLVETRDFDGNKIWKVEKKFLSLFWENYCEPFDTEFKSYDEALTFWSKIIHSNEAEKAVLMETEV